MASRAKARPLPKFGEWDVNNPSSAEGYTVIFNKARAEKKTTNNVTTGNLVSAQRTENPYVNTNEKKEKRKRPSKRKWFCFC